MVGGRGYGKRRRRRLSGGSGKRVRGGREGAASEGEVRGGRGGAWRHRGVEEEPSRLGGRRWPGRVAARAWRVPVLLAEEEGDRGGSGGGLGRQLELGQVG